METVFDMFGDLVETASFYKVDRTNPLGATKGDAQSVEIIIDDGSKTKFDGQVDTRTNDVLIYARPNSVLGTRACVGGFIRTTTHDPRTFRIEDFSVGGYGRADGHIELTATEVSA